MMRTNKCTAAARQWGCNRQRHWPAVPLSMGRGCSRMLCCVSTQPQDRGRGNRTCVTMLQHGAILPSAVRRRWPSGAATPSGDENRDSSVGRGQVRRHGVRLLLRRLRGEGAWSALWERYTRQINGAAPCCRARDHARKAGRQVGRGCWFIDTVSYGTCISQRGSRRFREAVGTSSAGPSDGRSHWPLVACSALGLPHPASMGPTAWPATRLAPSILVFGARAARLSVKNPGQRGRGCGITARS